VSLFFTLILIVDDDPPVRRILERVLRGKCERVIEAGSVDEAIEALKEKVDLVITDLRLGTGSGIDVALAAAKQHPAPPVVAMSGAADAADGVALGKVGVSAFLAKPFVPSQVMQVLERLQAPEQVELDAVVSRIVGTRNMPDVLDTIRRSMVLEALARTEGNKAQAAQLLGISRQHLQKILERGRA
jgi:DNA-binding NtrC family response regulator